MDGILIINKHKGCTSHDIVHKIKKITSSKKATKKFYEELENERKRKNEKFSGRRYANKK